MNAKNHTFKDYTLPFALDGRQTIRIGISFSKKDPSYPDRQASNSDYTKSCYDNYNLR